MKSSVNNLGLGHFIFFLTVILSVISCSRKTSGIPDDRKSDFILNDSIQAEQFREFLLNNIAFKYIAGKGQVQIKNADEVLESTIHSSLVSDSAIHISIRKLGIEIARLLLHQDSFKMLNRIEKTFNTGLLRQLEFLDSKLHLNQCMLQNILLFGYHLPETLDYRLSFKGKTYLLEGQSESEQILLYGDRLNLRPQRFIWKESNRLLESQIEEYRPLHEKSIPYKLTFRFTEPSVDPLNLILYWNKLDDRPIKSMSFNIPEHYTRIAK
ncbi:MAG: DUF4292 domain-containing protein [Saprospiraceae bacterium]|nr:DUF4292 domain-containing protein [Saprospiraceae bacterium]